MTDDKDPVPYGVSFGASHIENSAKTGEGPGSYVMVRGRRISHSKTKSLPSFDGESLRTHQLSKPTTE
jgi:hypothetical protein